MRLPSPWLAWGNRPSAHGAGLVQRRDVATFAATIPILVVAGVLVTELSSSYGSVKVLWVTLAFLGALASLGNLRVALVVLVFGLAFPFRTKLLFGLDVHTTHLLLAAIAILAMVRFFAGKLRVPRGMAVPILIILFGGALASIAGPDTAPALFRMGHGLVLPLVAGVAAAAALNPDRDLRALVPVVATTLTLTAVLALLQATGKAPSFLAPSFERDRVNGLFLHPNILGGYLTANILLLLGVAGYAWRRFAFAPVVLGGPIFLGIAGLAVTLSRGALAALAAGVIVITLLMAARRQALPVLAVVFLAAGILWVAVPTVPESQRAAFAARFQMLLSPGTETGRTLIYDEAFKVIRSYPLTGVGPLTFGVIASQRSTVPLLERSLTHAHNVFLEGYLSLGPIGLLGFLWLAAGAIRRLLAATRDRVGRANPVLTGWAIGSLGAVASMLVQGMADFLFWQVEMLTLLVILLGTGYAIGRRTQDPSA